MSHPPPTPPPNKSSSETALNGENGDVALRKSFRKYDLGLSRLAYKLYLDDQPTPTNMSDSSPIFIDG